MDRRNPEAPPAARAGAGPAGGADAAAGTPSGGGDLTVARPSGPIVPAEAAAEIIGRAAELDAGSPAAGPDLDEQALLDIGRDVGLSADSVRQALEQYRAGLLSTTAPEPTVVGPRTLVVERTLPGPIGRVDAMISAYLSGHVFDCCRRAGYTTMWRPSEGLIATIQRAGKRLTRARTLDDVTEIRLVLAERRSAAGRTPDVHVRLEAECAALRRGLAATAIAGTAVGGAGSVAAAGAAAVLSDPMPLLGLPPLIAVAAGSYLGSRHAYREKLAKVEVVLHGGLDEIAAAGR